MTLYAACTRKSLAEATALMVGDVNREFTHGNTALFPACRRGHVGIVTELIKRGANVNHANWSCETPLILACRHERYGVIKALIKHGADVNYSADLNKRAVHWNGYHTTVLNLALKRGHVKLAKMLILHGANPDSPDSRGDYPVCCALFNLESTKFFLGTYPDAAHRPIKTHGTMMLDYILFENARVEVFKYLVSRKVVDVVGGKVLCKTPLQWADEMDATWGVSYHHFKRILPHLYYARDEQRLTELCKIHFLVEKQRATVVPHVLQNTCDLSADLLEELSEYMAPRDVADKPPRPGCECGHC